MIQTDQNWLKLTKIYQNQPRLTQIDRNWPKLIEIDPNWPNSTQIDKIGGQYASASALASGQVTTKPVRKHWHDDKKLESQCVSTGVRTRYYNEDETKSKWVIDWQLTDWLTDWLLTDWLRLTEETEVRRTENLWFLVISIMCLVVLGIDLLFCLWSCLQTGSRTSAEVRNCLSKLSIPLKLLFC